MKAKLLLLICMIASTIMWSQNKSLWQSQSSRTTAILKESHKSLKEFQLFSLDAEALRQALDGTVQRNQSSAASNTIISFPNSEGKLERFSIKEASVMHPDLQERFPEIRSYVGQGMDDASSVLRFSISPEGFNGMILSAKGNTFIEPVAQGTSSYVVFNRENRINVDDDFECSVSAQVRQTVGSQSNIANRNADDSILRTYRLAVSATGEYTQYHGGTVAQALAAINTTMTRVNGIFEVDFNVTMTLIANTDDVIYTNTATDPYGNTTGGYNSQLQNTLTSVIGESNYDVGHLFANLQNNGNAGCIGCVCVNGDKGSGWTSAVNPVGDFFDVDYVAHELGHQFGANHTWTHSSNEGSGVQAEPGSGTTIMSYAGITGASTDVENNVTPNFHSLSIEQVTDYVKTTSCQTNTNTNNAVPVVNAGLDYTIPNGTAFILDGSATDADTPANALSYCWEQIDDNGNLSTFPSPTKTGGVAFRAYEPTTDTFRYFPRLETIKTGATSWQWEAVPSVARTLNFRLTVRDNVAGGGTNNSDDVVISVNGTAGPFVVNSPNTNVTWNIGATETVTWDVAGTTGNGVNAANVDILLSTDGGDTYPITLASGVINDGSHDIVVPNNQGTQNRIMVRGSNHIFFDISDTEFTIAPCNLIIPAGLAATNITASTATITWDANLGATFELRYREVGTTTYTNVANITTNSYLLTTLSSNTDYELQVRSVCTPSASAYSTTLLFSTNSTPACTGTLINAFPYEETFDSGIGDWTQANGDDGNWLLNNGTTPTGSGTGGNTGPSDDITGGGNYYYLESSSNNTPGEIGANATAIFESPCFDLSTASSPFVSFNHHMYGTNMGSLTLEITNNDGSTWTTLFTQSGDQGNQWNFEQFDLSIYENQTVRFRFIGTTGNGFRSDMAIDQFRIGSPIYCSSNGNDTSDEYISNVTLNGVSTDSPTEPTGGYTDFTNVIIDLDIDNTYQISITATRPNGPFNDGYAVWIDFNQDGDFLDSGEQVFTQSPTQDNPVTGNISIPANALFGQTRMRVSLKWNDIPDPCESFAYGEVEDYTVNIGFDGLLYTNNSWTPNAPDNTTGSINALVADGTSLLSVDVELNDITIRAGAEAVVDPTGSMTVNGSLVSDGTLTLNSVSDNYSSLIANGTVTGNVRYFRHANNTAALNEEDANDLIAPPVSGQAFNDFANNNDNIVSNSSETLYLFGPFEKPANTYVLYSDSETATLDAGKGYRAASTNSSTFEFVGTVNTGNVNVPIEVSGSTYPEWNLIGNPYPSYISLSDFLATNNTQLAAPNVAIYGYDGNASNGWTIWNQAYALLNPTAKITPGQGFLVASVAGGGTISFTPNMRTTGNTDDFIANRNDSSNISYFRLNLSSNNDSYHTEFYIYDNATLGLDPGFDARTFGNVAPNYSIYSQLVEENDGIDMAVQAISNSDITNNAIIPLGINATSGQQITINLSESTLPDSINIYLEDRQNNTFTLLNDVDYVLTAATGLNGIGRFYLRFNQSTLNIEDGGLETIQIISLENPKHILIKGQFNEPSKFKLYDIRGREVLKQSLKQNIASQAIDTSELLSGVYLVEIQNSKSKISKKLIVR